MLQEECFEALVQSRLVAFDRQTLVGLLGDDLFGNLCLTAHRVNRDQCTGNLNHLQQFRDLSRF